MISEPGAADLLGALADLRAGRLTVARAWAMHEAAERHGMLAIFADAALTTDLSPEAEPRARLAEHLRNAVARDAVQQAATRRVIDALAAADVRAVVLKGEHVARAFYPEPWLRPHLDTDVLIDPAQRPAACRAIEGLGYVPLLHVGGDAILAEMPFTCNFAGMAHAVDLHWHVVTPHPFRGILVFSDAWDRSAPVDALGPAARGLSRPDALLLSVVHLAVHHPCDVRLMWIADVDLIARTLTAAEWTAFESAASAARVCSIAFAALQTAARFFLTPLPAGLAARLEVRGAAEAIAPEYLLPRSRAERLLTELRSIPRWRDRAAVVYQHLMPDARYMRERYDANGAGVMWTYVRRAASGARAWLERPNRGRSRELVDPARHAPHAD